MKELSKKYDKICWMMDPINTWLEKARKDVENKAFRALDRSLPSKTWGFGTAAFVISVIGTLFSLMHYAHRDVLYYSTAGWCFLGTGILGLATWIWLGSLAIYRTDKLRAQTKAELLAKNASDPLYMRAVQIRNAMKSYVARLDQYRAWCDAVDDGLMPDDKDAAESNMAYIVRAHSVLSRAITNFINTLELVHRQEKYQQAHPDIDPASENGALADLIAVLNKPVEAPKILAASDPRTILDGEDALAEVVADPEEDLTRRIEEASAKKKTAAG